MSDDPTIYDELEDLLDAQERDITFMVRAHTDLLEALLAITHRRHPQDFAALLDARRQSLADLPVEEAQSAEQGEDRIVLEKQIALLQLAAAPPHVAGSRQ